MRRRSLRLGKEAGGALRVGVCARRRRWWQGSRPKEPGFLQMPIHRDAKRKTAKSKGHLEQVGRETGKEQFEPFETPECAIQAKLRMPCRDIARSKLGQKSNPVVPMRGEKAFGRKARLGQRRRPQCLQRRSKPKARRKARGFFGVAVTLSWHSAEWPNERS